MAMTRKANYTDLIGDELPDLELGKNIIIDLEKIEVKNDKKDNKKEETKENNEK